MSPEEADVAGAAEEVKEVGDHIEDQTVQWNIRCNVKSIFNKVYKDS